MKVKFPILFILFLAIAILLAGCHVALEATVSGIGGISTVTQLAVGTLKLEATSNAVSSAQAAQLLTLWEGYQSINQSDTSSQLELDALVNQIQGMMTTDQLQAIKALDLNEQSVSEGVQSLGNSTNTRALVSTPGSSTLNQAGPGGGLGGMPSGAGGDSVMRAINGGASTQSTPAATQSPNYGGSIQVSSIVLNALIQMLNARIQTTG